MFIRFFEKEIKSFQISNVNNAKYHQLEENESKQVKLGLMSAITFNFFSSNSWYGGD